MCSVEVVGCSVMVVVGDWVVVVEGVPGYGSTVKGVKLKP